MASIDATIVTADRDFFQLVRPGITVMFNRKGISDIVRYDESGVEEDLVGRRALTSLLGEVEVERELLGRR